MADVEFRSDVTVELVRAAAQDADVLFAARVSTKGEQSLEDVDSDAGRSQGLINYLMRPEVMAAISNATGYPTSNAKARPMVEASMRDNPDIYLDEKAYARLFPGQDIPQRDMRSRMRTWTSFKTGTGG